MVTDTKDSNRDGYPLGDSRLSLAEGKLDYTVRIITDGTTTHVPYCEPTTTTKQSLRAFLSEKWDEAVSVFVEVIRKQNVLIDYNSHYVAFLLGQLTEEEFTEISEAYVRETAQKKEVEEKTLILLSSTGIAFSPNDLAYFWGCSREDVENALQNLREKNLITYAEI